jgi:hypothetical protein
MQATKSPVRSITHSLRQQHLFEMNQAFAPNPEAHRPTRPPRFPRLESLRTALFRHRKCQKQGKQDKANEKIIHSCSVDDPAALEKSEKCQPGSAASPTSAHNNELSRGRTTSRSKEKTTAGQHAHRKDSMNDSLSNSDVEELVRWVSREHRSAQHLPEELQSSHHHDENLSDYEDLTDADIEDLRIWVSRRSNPLTRG